MILWGKKIIIRYIHLYTQRKALSTLFYIHDLISHTAMSPPSIVLTDGETEYAPPTQTAGPILLPRLRWLSLCQDFFTLVISERISDCGFDLIVSRLLTLMSGLDINKTATDGLSNVSWVLGVDNSKGANFFFFLIQYFAQNYTVLID